MPGKNGDGQLQKDGLSGVPEEKLTAGWGLYGRRPGRKEERMVSREMLFSAMPKAPMYRYDW